MLPAAKEIFTSASNNLTTQLLFLSNCIRPQRHRNADDVSAAIKMAAVSECTDTPVASQKVARHACLTWYVSDTASRVVQLCSCVVGIVAVLEDGVAVKMEEKKALPFPPSFPIHLCSTSDRCFSPEPADAQQRNGAGCQAPTSPAMMPSCTALSVKSTFCGATVLITGYPGSPPTSLYPQPPALYFT